MEGKIYNIDLTRNGQRYIQQQVAKQSAAILLGGIWRQLEPRKIIKNGPATIVFWRDGSKTVVKRKAGAIDSTYTAFCAALAKEIFGGTKQVQRMIERVETKTQKQNREIEFSAQSRFGKCWNCNYELYSELIGEYEIQNCPKCGAGLYCQD